MAKFLFLIFLGVYFLSNPLCFAAQNENNSKKIKSLGRDIPELKAQVNRVPKVRARRRSSEFDFPKLNIRGFGHFQYEADENSHDWEIGNMDLFLSSQVARKLKFFSETIFQFQEGDEQEIDIERIILKYEHADWLNISVGRGHTAIGFWNHKYHHGRWLYPTIDRPVIFRFEDEGGILPVHFVGFEVMGRVHLGMGNLTYTADFANGRGRTRGKVQLVADSNDSKMISLMFTFEPDVAPGFGFGSNFIFDHIPNRPSVGRINDTQEIITGGHAFYIDNTIELTAEYQYIDHNSIIDNSHWGGYIQVSYKMGKVQPYYRFDIMEIDNSDTFFASAQDINQHTFGIRYDLFSFAAVKFEYRHASSKVSTQGAPNSGTIQVAFAF